MLKNRLQFAAKMAGGHLLLSLLLAACTAVLVFKVWYPHPYDIILGGLGLYSLVMIVDVVCGPLMTLILASPAKSKRQTAQDLALVVFIQLAALVYGLYTVSIARPVAVVFEVDRFVAVSAVDVVPESLAAAKPEMQQLSWSGAKRIALREPADQKQVDQLLDLSLSGKERSMMPDWWEADNPKAREKIKEKMRPVSELQAAYPNHADLAQAVAQTGMPPNRLFFLPFTSALNKEWVVLLDEQTDFVGFAPVDGFLQAKN